MSFIDDGALFPDKIATGTIGTRDPRTVPQASNFNDLKGAALELRTEVLARAKVTGGGVQGFWVGSTPPPDATWIWIVTGDAPAQPVSITAAAAVLGLSAVAPGVQAVGGPKQIAALAVALGLAAQVPAVQALGGRITLYPTAVALGLAAPAPGVTALSAGGGGNLVFSNGGFESALTPATDWDATTAYGTQGSTEYGTQVAARDTVSPISGSASLRIRVDSGNSEGFLDNKDSGAGASQYRTKAQVEAGPIVKFKMKPLVNSFASMDLVVHAYDGSSQRVDQAGGDGAISLFGTITTGADQTTLRVASPVIGQVYQLSFDVMTWLSTRYKPAKGWANVATVEIRINAYQQGMQDNMVAEALFDDFGV